LDINSAQIEKELAEQLGVTQQAISIRLHTMEKVQKEGRWVPHELSEDNKNRQRNILLTLLSKFQKKDFLHKIITGDEKWNLYDNPKHKKSLVDPGQLSTSSPISTPRRFYYLSGGIGKMYCIMNYYNRVKQLRQIATNNN